MSILDDAIREHLELKRAHGADDAELKKLEDEAFGPPQRPDEPDPFAEAPTEFLVAPEVGAGEQLDEEPGARRAPNIADLQEAPEPRQAPDSASGEEAPADESPAEEEHEAIAEPGHSTEERHAIASQPTEMFDVEGQFEDAATEGDAPSDEQLIDAELGEPRLAPVDPLAGIEASAGAETEALAEPDADDEPADEFDEFFSEQRLSDELNQALEAPLPDEPVLAPAEEGTGERLAPVEEGTAIYDVESEFAGDAEAEPNEEPPPADADVTDEHELATPEAPPEPEPEDLEDEDDEPDVAAPPAAAAAPPAASHEDVLEDTPEFLEDAPEDDDLWFEQKPPKDFDFDD
jgi:hypothetical protein